MKRFKQISLTFILIIYLMSNTSAIGIENGEKAIGGPVSALLQGSNPLPFCSAVMIEARIAVTDKHCANSSYLPSFHYKLTYPGEDRTYVRKEPAEVLQVISSPGSWKFSEQNATLDDIAFLIIDRDFPVPNNLRIPTEDEFNTLLQNNAETVTFGYGMTSFQNTASSYLPYKFYSKLSREIRFPDEFVVSLDNIQNPCGGDSGGPTYVLSNNDLYYIGPTSSVHKATCVEPTVKEPSSFSGTLITFHRDLYLKAKVELSKLILREKSKLSVTIFCKRGILIKKISGIKPICPKGFQKILKK